MWEKKGKKEEHTIIRKHKVKLQYITNSNKYEFSKFIYKRKSLSNQEALQLYTRNIYKMKAIQEV